MKIILRAVCGKVSEGATIKEIHTAIAYSEYIYNRRAFKFYWRGKIFDFVKEFPRGIYIVNCNNHLALVFNGALFSRKFKNYNVYNAWKILTTL